VITLFVPDSWKEQAASAIDQLNAPAVWRTWRLVDDNQADVRLVNEAGGVIVGETAVALTVPFTLDWESVSNDRANEILNEGHELVSVIPWHQMRPGQKALRVDGLGPADSKYPLKDTWSLKTDAPFNDAVYELAPFLQKTVNDEVFHLAAVGDIMLDRSLGYGLQQGDLTYPFSDVAGQLQEADVTVGNVESALGDLGEPEQKRYPFRAPPEAAGALGLGGFDIVSLANNHGMDYGQEALLQAIDLLQQKGVMPVGAGGNSSEARAPEIIEVNNLKTAFFGYVNVPAEASTGFDTASWTATEETPGIAWADPQVIAEDVAAIREQVDLIVVMLHSGFEYLPTPSEPQIEAAHAAVDAGADLVIGHHAHILQGIEYYGNGVIIYGTGNFAFDIDGPPETAIFHIWLDENGVREIAIEAAIVQFGGKPRLAASWEAQPIRNRVYYLTNLLNTN
jgi:poly-gamma-glutamate synthesis protein (capsule biosynthesis protein)